MGEFHPNYSELLKFERDFENRHNEVREYLDSQRLREFYNSGLAQKYAEDLIDEIIGEAKTTFAASAKTVLGNISTLEVGRIEIGYSTVTVDINMSNGNLYRPSVREDRYGGIDNIVKLFITGYQASNRTYGRWHGQDIATSPFRAPNPFIKEAISHFNRTHSNIEGFPDIEMWAMQVDF